MKLPTLVAADLHLTGNIRDEYRWQVFQWAKSERERAGIKHFLILGDLTDAKDNHAAPLVNRIVDEVKGLADLGILVTIMKGNHDYYKDGHPFFEFLNALPGVRFISEIEKDLESPAGVFYLPHTKTPKEDWEGLDFSIPDYIFMHQTVSGAVASNGQAMEGELKADFGYRRSGKIFSGDIHVPQVIGDVEYVGSPYPVHFGDRFESRMILITGPDKWEEVSFPCLQKFTAEISSVDDLNDLKLGRGDQIKLRINLHTRSGEAWAEIKREAVEWCRAEGIFLCGIELIPKKRRKLLAKDQILQRRAATRSPEEAVKRFGEHEKLESDFVEAGLEIIRCS
jgi:hypothetical protein